MSLPAFIRKRKDLTSHGVSLVEKLFASIRMGDFSRQASKCLSGDTCVWVCT